LQQQLFRPGSLAISTVLSLPVVPAFYVVTDRIRSKVLRKRTAVPDGAEAV